MSRADEPGEQATLGDTVDRAMERARSDAAAEGARYGRREPVSDPPGEQCLEARCRCGAEISTEMARVVGDNDGIVPCCAECAKNTYSKPIGSTPRAVQHWHSERKTVISEREVPCEDGDGTEIVEVEG